MQPGKIGITSSHTDDVLLIVNNTFISNAIAHCLPLFYLGIALHYINPY